MEELRPMKGYRLPLRGTLPVIKVLLANPAVALKSSTVRETLLASLKQDLYTRGPCNPPPPPQFITVSSPRKIRRACLGILRPAQLRFVQNVSLLLLRMMFSCQIGTKLGLCSAVPVYSCSISNQKNLAGSGWRSCQMSGLRHLFCLANAVRSSTGSQLQNAEWGMTKEKV